MTGRLTVFAMTAIFSCFVLAGTNAAKAQKKDSCREICHGILCSDFSGCGRGCASAACSQKRNQAVKACLRSCKRSDGRRSRRAS